MMKRTFPLFLWVFALALLCFSTVYAYEGEDIGYIDAVTVNDRHFEDLDENQIVFYREDLVNGEVIIRGLLEQEKDEIPVSEMAVEVTFNGGRTWIKTEGNASWEARFRPELEREYEFGVRVVQTEPAIADKTEPVKELKLKLGDFVLTILELNEADARARSAQKAAGRNTTRRTKQKAKNQAANLISGVGSIDLGFLSEHIPAEFKVPETNALKVAFNNLRIDKGKGKGLPTITGGSVMVNFPVSQKIEIFSNAVLKINKIIFKTDSALIDGKISYTGDLIIPTIPFNSLAFSPRGIKGLVQYTPEKVKRIALISGDYGIDLLLKKIALNLNTINPSVSVKDVDLSLDFADIYGDLKHQAVSYARGAYQWGSAAQNTLSGFQPVTDEIVIPYTGVRLSNIGGTIKGSFDGITLQGKMKIPTYGEDFLELDLSELSDLEINTRGISLLKKITLTKLEKEFDISGFKAKAEKLILDIKDNAVSGSLDGQLKLQQLGETYLNIGAEIESHGLSKIKTELNDINKTITIPSFADLNLSKVKLAFGRSGLSVALDGGLTITNPALKNLTNDLNRDKVKEKFDFYNALGKAEMSKTVSSVKGAGRNAVSGARGTARGAVRNATAAINDFSFKQLKIYKDRLELPALYSGWHDLATPLSGNIDNFRISADAWGLGSESGKLWAGIKGSTEISGSAVSSSAKATAKFYSDGTYRVLDFEANATIKIGDFTLYTDASMSGGSISGSGNLVSDFTIPSIPDSLKDAEGRLNLDVNFQNLDIDPNTMAVLGGSIEVPTDFEIPFDLADLKFSKFTFSKEAALAEVQVFLKGFDGIEGIKIDDIALTSGGLAGSVTYSRPRRNPLTYTFFEAPYDLTAVFRSVKISFNTGDMRLSLDDLDAVLQMGENYDIDEFTLGLKDNLFAWGQALTDEAMAEAEKLRIPGTNFFIENPGGYIKIGETVALDLFGKIEVPGFDGELVLDIPSDKPLKLSKDGISTAAEIVLENLADKISFEGFPAKLDMFSFGMSNNTVTASFDSTITLEQFGGMSARIKGSFDNSGIKKVDLDLENIDAFVNLDGFASAWLKNLDAGFGEKGFYVGFDTDIAITHPMLSGFLAEGVDPEASADAISGKVEDQLSGLANDAKNEAAAKVRKIALTGVKVFGDAISFAEDLEGWHSLTPPAAVSINAIDLALMEWGLGVESNRFWVGLKGNAAAMSGNDRGAGSVNAETTMTAQFFSDGDFRLLDFDFKGEFALGPFKLRTDASFSNGTLSGDGVLITETPLSDEVQSYLPAALIDAKTKCLNAAVSFSDLAVNQAENIITSGMISIEQTFDFSVGDILDMNISRLGFTATGMSLDGVMNIPELSGMVSLPGIAFTGINLGLDGFSGTSTITTDWPRGNPLRIELINDLIGLELSAIGVSINWAKSGPDMFSLTSIDGSIDFGTLLEQVDSAKKQALSFVDNTLKFTVPDMKIPDTDIGFKDIIAKIDLSGELPVIDFERIKLDLDIYGNALAIASENIKIDSTGLNGLFSLSDVSTGLDEFGFDAKLNNIAVQLDNSLISSGSLDLNVTLKEFFNMKFGVKANVGMAGVNDFKLNMNNIPGLSIANTVDVSLKQDSLSLGYSDAKGVFFEIEPVFKITNDVLASMESFSLEGLRVFTDAIEVDGVGLSRNLDINFGLGPADVQLDRVGLKLLTNDIEFTFDGSIELESICGAEASISLSKSKGFKLNNITLDYQANGVNMAGTLKWLKEQKEGAEVTGGFSSDVKIAALGLFDFSGGLTIGEGESNGRNFTFWRVELSIPATVPLGPLPLNIYKIGGGLAYNMSVNRDGGPNEPLEFEANPNNPICLIANAQLGTTDNGYSWHGDFKLIVEPAEQFILFRGDSYVMASKESSPSDRRLSAEIQIGASPKLFRLRASAKLVQKKGDFELFALSGSPSSPNSLAEFDILFSESDWHVYVGSKDNPIGVRALNKIFSAEGYFMIDSAGLMLGVKKEFNLSGSIACFYGKVYGGASFDLASSIKPFYIDATGRVWVGIDAGVKAAGKKFSIINAYADLGLKIRTPDPTFIRIKAKFGYSFLGGMVSGTFRMTFWVPEKPENYSNLAYEFPLITYMTPEDGGSNISRVPDIELNTSIPIDTPIKLDDNKWYVLRLVDLLHAGGFSLNGKAVPKAVDISNIDNVKDALLLQRVSGGLVQKVGGLLDNDSIYFRPKTQLAKNTEYKITSKAMLCQLKSSEFSHANFKTQIKDLMNLEAKKSMTFTTNSSKDLDAITVIEKVSPSPFDSVVYPDTEVRIYYRVQSLGQQVSLNNNHYIKDPLGRIIVQPNSWQQGLATTDYIHATEQWIKFVKPQTPLRPILVYKNNESGEIKEAAFVNGNEFNPFTMEPFTEYNATTSSDASATAYTISAPGAAAVQEAGGEYTEVGSNVGTTTITLNSFSRYYKNDYRLEVYSPEPNENNGYDLIYSSRFNVSVPQNGENNEDIINQSINAGNNYSAFDIDFLVSGATNADFENEYEPAIEEWNTRHDAFKASLLNKFKQMYQNFPGVLCCATLEDGLRLSETIRNDYDEWLILNPQPVNLLAYGSASGDIVLNFKTNSPLNWSSLNFEFEYNAGRYGMGWNLTADRTKYRIVSSPNSTEHIIQLPVYSNLDQGSKSMFDELGGYFGGQSGYANAEVKAYSVTTTQQNGHYSISKSGEPLVNWFFRYKNDFLGNQPTGGDVCDPYCHPEFEATYSGYRFVLE